MEKRRQALQEQQRKEQERLAALEREEQERKVEYWSSTPTLCVSNLNLLRFIGCNKAVTCRHCTGHSLLCLVVDLNLLQLSKLVGSESELWRPVTK